MFRKGLMVAAVCLMPAFAMAQNSARGPFELTLSGSGSNGPNFNGFSAGASASLGYFLTDNIEIAGRETVTYDDINVKAFLDTDTRVALDLNFPLGDQGQFVPYVGANIGYIAGGGVKNQWEAAPEGGIKLFVNNSTFIFLNVEYQFFFDQNSNAGQSFRNGEFIYGLGIGFRF